MAFEIVFGGPAESKGAKRAVAPGLSAQLGQENEARNRFERNEWRQQNPSTVIGKNAPPGRGRGTTDKQLMGEHSENREDKRCGWDVNATARTELIGATAMTFLSERPVRIREVRSPMADPKHSKCARRL